MLVVARSPGQTLVIDERIRVTVLAAARGIVRLGIEAPPDVVLRRAELARRRDDGTRATDDAVEHAAPPAADADQR